MQKIKRQVGEYLAYCEKVRRMTEATMRMKENILERFVRVTGVGSLEELTNEVFNVWVASLTERGVSPRSINTYNAAVLAMVRYYRGVGVEIPLRIALVGKLKEGQVRRRFYTDEEVNTAISYAGFETGLMIRIMFETGMRIAELTRLKVSDFDGRRVQFIGKGRKPREVYVREDTLMWVREFMRERGVVDGYLFATLNGEPPTVATVRKRLRRPFVAAGFDDFYPHSLRHSFATNLQMRGASVEEIKEMIGHESVATTERYLHGFEGRLEELFDKYLG
ncbi:tyrosine-type recombinase/integrase [Candidatus Saccharibacteria bacterium]|nr:tyrosine-type recombinase/integrase [Candidatus Saccharibacteria bacterium]